MRNPSITHSLRLIRPFAICTFLGAILCLSVGCSSFSGAAISANTKGQSSDSASKEKAAEILGSAAAEAVPHSVSGKAETVKGGLSELVVSGSLFAKAKTVASDKSCLIEITGAGVDRYGDPGVNLYLENLSSRTLDFWINDSFTVDGKPCRAYLFETLNPGQSTSTLLQFDTADLKSTSLLSLVNVSGKILVDSPDGEFSASYPFVLESIPK